MELITFTDIETTGKLDPAHRIIELSMRVCDLNSQKELKNVLMRFNPERSIHADAFAVHGIAIEELKGKPLIATAIPSIINVFSKSKYNVAHNGDYFDFPFIKMEVERNGFEFPEITTFDTMVNGNFATELGKSPSLKELCWCMDVEYDPAKAHAGDYDTLVMRDAFFKALNEGWFKL